MRIRYELIDKISTGLAGYFGIGYWVKGFWVSKVVPPKATGFGGCRTGETPKRKGRGEEKEEQRK